MGYIACRVESAMMHMRERLIPSLLALDFFLSLIQLVDAFQIRYFPMKDGFLYSLRFDLGFGLGPVLLPVAFVILAFFLLRRDFLVVFVSCIVTLLVHIFFGFEAAVAVFSLIQVVMASYRFIDFGEFILWFLVLITGFEGLALMHWVVFPFGLASPFGWFAELEMELFYIASNLAPFIFVLILMIVFVDLLRRIPGVKDLANEFQILKLLREIISYYINKNPFSMQNMSESSEPDKMKIILFLFLTMLLGFIAAFYPYSSAVNPDNLEIGVDIPHYVYDARIVEKDVFLSFEAWNHTRPMIFFTIYGFQKFFGLNVLTAVRFLPILLNPLLALTAFFLASEVHKNRWLGVWAAFFTISGFQVVVGMYSYFLANMLCLCFIYASLGFLFRAIRKDNRVSLMIACVFGGLSLFTHPWTSVQYFMAVIATAVVLGYYGFFKHGNMREFVMISVYLVSLIFIELFKALVFQGVGMTSASTRAVTGFSSLLDFWSLSIHVFRDLYGGLMSNIVLLGLAVGGIYLLRQREVPEIYFSYLLVITTVVFLFGDGVIKSRLLYNIPIGLFSASGFVTFLRFKYAEDFKMLFTSFIVLSMIVYLFRSLANFI